MAHLSYLAVLAACLVCVTPLAVAARRSVLAQRRRLVVSVLITAALFAGWDLYAIHAHQWTFTRATTTGLLLPGRLPIEEALFFLIIPFCMILTYETVKRILRAPQREHSTQDAA